MGAVEQKHNHRDAFNRRADCPRCGEMATPAPLSTVADVPVTPEPSIIAPVASIAGMHFRGTGKAADEWGPKPAPAATTKVMCWLCLGNHGVPDCPRLEQARRSGDSTTLRLLRSEGLA